MRVDIGGDGLCGGGEIVEQTDEFCGTVDGIGTENGAKMRGEGRAVDLVMRRVMRHGARVLWNGG